MKRYTLAIFISLNCFLLISCQKEIDKSRLNVRNDIAYEINSGVPFTGRCIEKDQSGNFIKYEVNYKNGKKDGEEVARFNTGQLNYILTYEDGLLNGKAVVYSKNGQKLFDINFEKNRLVGTLVEYDYDGKLNNKCNVDGKFSYTLYDQSFPESFYILKNEDILNFATVISQKNSSEINILSRREIDFFHVAKEFPNITFGLLTQLGKIEYGKDLEKIHPNCFMKISIWNYKLNFNDSIQNIISNFLNKEGYKPWDATSWTKGSIMVFLFENEFNDSGYAELHFLRRS